MKNKILIPILLVLLASLGLNFFLWQKNNLPEEQLSTNEYTFVNPLSKNHIDNNTQEEKFILHYQDLRPLIEKEIKKNTDMENIGFFLQDVKTGAWLGINEREGFIPASLLKVPIMMAILKKVENDEIDFKQEIEIQKEDFDENAGDLYQQKVGTKINIWNLLEKMILSSDNTAKNILKRQLSIEELNAPFAHVGITNPYQNDNAITVTPRGYSRFFKALYLSTFLKPQLSEKALSLATDTVMESLISAGIPPEIQVAHKYGERPDGLHDCGVVYHPQNPYFICVMSRNVELTQDKELIKNLSKITYEFVSKK